MRKLTEQELHNLAMNIVGKELERHGFEFLAVNSKPKKNPQFVCLKEKKTHFIVVRAVPYPEDPLAPDLKLLTKVKDHAEKFEAESYYAGVGLYNADNKEEAVLLDQPYEINFKGMIPIQEFL